MKNMVKIDQKLDPDGLIESELSADLIEISSGPGGVPGKIGCRISRRCVDQEEVQNDDGEQHGAQLGEPTKRVDQHARALPQDGAPLMTWPLPRDSWSCPKASRRAA